jgi:hypothetical protein
VVAAGGPRYFGCMADQNPSPWKLTPARIVILILGALIVLYTASTMLGGLSNYQQLKEGATTETPATTPASP